MADIVDAATRSRMMSGIRAKDTKPEMVVRKLLHASGFRFRLHRKDLPGKPDIVLPKYQTAVFVNGCYWHGHERCHLYRPPKSRAEFWTTKIAGNRERDNRNTKALQKDGWNVIIVWECAVSKKKRLDDAELRGALAHAILSNAQFTEIRAAI